MVFVREVFLEREREREKEGDVMLGIFLTMIGIDEKGEEN